MGNAGQLSRYLFVIVAVALCIFSGRLIASYFRRIFTPPAPPTNVTVLPEPTVTSGPAASVEPLAIDEEIYHIECDANGRVKSVIFVIRILGGMAPYDIEFEPGDVAYTNLLQSSVLFTLPGGTRVVVRVTSALESEKPIVRDIYAPSTHAYCTDQLATNTLATTSTSTPTPGSATASNTLIFTNPIVGGNDDSDGSDIPANPNPSDPNTPVIPTTSTPSKPTTTPLIVSPPTPSNVPPTTSVPTFNPAKTPGPLSTPIINPTD